MWKRSEKHFILWTSTRKIGHPLAFVSPDFPFSLEIQKRKWGMRIYSLPQMGDYLHFLPILPMSASTQGQGSMWDTCFILECSASYFFFLFSISEICSVLNMYPMSLTIYCMDEEQIWCALEIDFQKLCLQCYSVSGVHGSRQQAHVDRCGILCTSQGGKKGGETQSQEAWGRKVQRGGTHCSHTPGGHLSMHGINHPGYHKSSRFAKCTSGCGWGVDCRSFPLNVMYVLHILDSSTVRKAFLGWKHESISGNPRHIQF